MSSAHHTTQGRSQSGESNLKAEDTSQSDDDDDEDNDVDDYDSSWYTILLMQSNTLKQKQEKKKVVFLEDKDIDLNGALQRLVRHLTAFLYIPFWIQALLVGFFIESMCIWAA